MEVRNCRQCGRLYNYIGGTYKSLCPDCIRKLEDKFEEVKEYIEEHRSAPMNQISQDCDVSIKQIEQWVRDERLVFSDDSPIGIACENCGATIKSGRYCDNCKSKMVNRLESAYSSRAAGVIDMQNSREKKEAARMRYLDR